MTRRMLEETEPTAETTSTPAREDVTDTKERLLEAGMHEFAERGFKEASIRRICARAKANPAAVNYHFGDKQRFYAEVLVTCHQRASQHRPMPQLEDNPENPEEVLRSWILWFLDRLLVQARKIGPLGKLMAREMFEPTPAFDEVIRRSLLPIHRSLTEIVQAVLGTAEPRQVQLAVHCVLGQCLLYKHAEPAFERLHSLLSSGELPEFPHPLGGEGQLASPLDLASDLESLARYIAEFSLAGIRRFSNGQVGEDS